MYVYDSKMQYINTMEKMQNGVKSQYIGGPFITDIPMLRYDKGLIDYKPDVMPVMPAVMPKNDNILLYIGVAILIIIII